MVLGSGFSRLNSPKFKTENVIVLVIDGPRYSETWGDSLRQYIPFMSKELAPQGVFYDSFYNVGKTYTAAGHTSICTGIDQSIDNTGKEIPQYPSFFQYYLKSKNNDADKTWIITSKDKLAVLANCKDSLWQDEFMPKTDCGAGGLLTLYRDDSTTMAHVFKTLKNNHPNLLLINLREPDYSGHAANWQGYLNGIVAGDRYAYELWKYIQSDSAYANKTTLFITNDHGRHLEGVKNGFINHGDDCDGCRHISLLALGPDFKNNITVSKQRNQKDIPSTIAYLLGFEMPTSKGEVMMELFK